MIHNESREKTKIEDHCFGQEAKEETVCFLYLGERGRFIQVSARRPW